MPHQGIQIFISVRAPVDVNQSERHLAVFCINCTTIVCYDFVLFNKQFSPFSLESKMASSAERIKAEGSQQQLREFNLFFRQVKQEKLRLTIDFFILI